MNDIKNSNYVKEINRLLYEEWEKETLPEYLLKGHKIQNLAKFRCGNAANSSKYWLPNTYKLCRLCKAEEETLNISVKNATRFSTRKT